MKMMKKILFVEFCNASPHLETSLEIAKKHLDEKDEVYWYFWGHQVPFTEWNRSLNSFPPLMAPEQRGVRRIKRNNKLHVDFAIPDIKERVLAIPDTFSNIDELIEFKWNNINIGAGVANSLVTHLKGTPTDLPQYHSFINLLIESYVLSFQATSKVVEEISPDCAYVFNGRFCCQHAAASALKQLGVPLYYHERGADKNRYHITQVEVGDVKSWQKNIVNAWQKAINKNRNEAVVIGERFFIDKRKGTEQGWLAYNTGQTAGKLPDLPKEKKIITYFHSSDDEYLISNKLFGNEPWNHQVKAFEALLEGVQRSQKYHLVVRLHPHLAVKSEEDRIFWQNYPFPADCTVILPESDMDSYSLIDASDAVVTYGSTIGVESVYWGVPSILLGRSLYDELGGVTKVTDKNELFRVLDDGPELPQQHDALAYGYYMNTFGTQFTAYQPQSLFKGKFMGTNLQEQPLWLELFRPLWSKL